MGEGLLLSSRIMAWCSLHLSLSSHLEACMHCQVSSLQRQRRKGKGKLGGDSWIAKADRHERKSNLGRAVP